MYAGLVSMLAGTAIMLGTATPFLVLPVFVAVLVTRFIGKEERGLERQFGGRYLAYKREVRRWF
jgi:protein-S-isoprenylcysteine O-methyltransferase Ste14